jgi:hypothetical protein
MIKENQTDSYKQIAKVLLLDEASISNHINE